MRRSKGIIQRNANEAGFSLVSLMVTVGLAGGVAVLGSNMAKQAKQLSNPIKKAADVSDLKHLVYENFDCDKTLAKVTCNNSKIDTFQANGSRLTSSVGTDFYRNKAKNNEYEFIVSASCDSKNDFNFFYTLKTPFMEEKNPQHLFDEIPIACGFVPTAGPCQQGVDVITFEEFANGEGISGNAFEAQYGVRISTNRPLEIAKNGSRSNVDKGDKAFMCNNCPGGDTPNGVGDETRTEIGKNFLTDVGKGGTDMTMTVNYTNPVTAASGTILDLDGKEKWIVRAYSGNTLVYSKTYQGQRNQDHIPTVWKVENDPPVEFDRLELRGTDNGKQFGLAFDNFSPSSVCDPFSLP